MAILSILKFPDPRLKLVAEPIDKFDGSLATLVLDMFDTMYSQDGVGLAATQVNVHKRLFVIDVSEHRDERLCIINPLITKQDGKIVQEEGCLSFPGLYAKVTRSSKVTLSYQDINGAPQTLEADGLLAICIQHELDHLNGITFFDRLSSLKQKLLRNKLDKMRETS